MHHHVSRSVRFAVMLGAGIAAIGIPMAGAVGVAHADKPCKINCHTPNPRPLPPIVVDGPSCGGIGQPLCPMQPPPLPPGK
ncbi:hypothetical protein FOS14_14475 [Skermania sp. ID1734]|uniref:hypothetical protein n=1 Tax=Skermania sp. ID1734 TaxID=2597516 RepID=UPI0011811126|nr:hypothetical protein [Skermania sp. ID1734]TSD98186.1 hypothetical protein FOS14_14475 [Skermania sp. ID1734]